MLLGSHLPNLLLARRAASKHPQEMPSSANMADTALVELKNPHCPRNHTKDSTNRPRQLRVRLKVIPTSSRSPSNSHNPGLSLPHRTTTLRTTPQTPSNVMLTTTTTSNSMDTRVRRASRTVLHHSRDHTVGMVVPKPKEPLNFNRVQLSRPSLATPQLEKVKTVATLLQTQLLRLNSQELPRVPNLSQATHNSPRVEAIHTDTLTTRARITRNT